MVPFELQLKVEGFNKRRDDDLKMLRRIAWEAEAMSRGKTLPSLENWEKKMGPQNTAEDRRQAEESRKLLEEHSGAGDTEALERFVKSKKEAAE